MPEGKTIWNLTALLTANVSEYMAKMEQAKKKTSSMGDSLSELKRIAAAAFSVGAVTQFVKTSVQAYMESEKAAAMLNNALKGRVDIQGRLEAQAKRLQATTVFEDDAITAQQAYLAALGFTEDQIRKTIDASVQLATVSGKDLHTAVEMLAKSYSGQLKGIQVLIPEVKNLSTVQLQAGEAVDLAFKKFAGSAETAAKTTEGSIARMKNAWGDIMENAGGALMSSKWFTESLDEWTRFLKVMGSGNIGGAEKFAYILSLYGLSEDASGPLANQKRIEALADGLDKVTTETSELNPELLKLVDASSQGTYALDKLTGSLVNIQDQAANAKTAIKGFYDAVQKESSIALESWMTGTEGASGTGSWLGGIGADPDPVLEPWMMGQGHLEKGGPWQEAQDAISSFRDNIMPEMNNVKQELSNFIQGVNSTINDGLTDLIVTTTESLSGLFTGQIKTSEDFFNPIYKLIGEYAQKMGAFLIADAIAFKVLQDWKAPWQAKLAAGIALVGIGAAIAHTSKSLSSSMGGAGGAGSFGGGGYAGSLAGVLPEKSVKELTIKIDGEIRGDKLKIVSDRGSYSLLQK